MSKQRSDNKDKLSFKEIYQNKRYKAMIQLGFYVIFFIFLFILIGSNQSAVDNRNYEGNGNKNINIKDNFTYDYTFEITREGINDIINYIGSINDNENLGKKSINNKTDEFYLKDNITYILGVIDEKWYVQEENYNIYEEIDTTFINYNDILKMIEKGELVSTETLHKDKTTSKTYEISLIDAINLYESINKIESKEIDEKLEETVVIKLYEKDSTTVKVELDATQLLKYYDPLIEKYFITLNYSNIGTVPDFNIDLGLD
ncbi:MAG: hypothetical protein PHS45_01555 [Bacilli bacterium]|nr:hypothetical protein [Bacilli bacterium]